MSAPRRFARFRPSEATDRGFWGVPEDGLCLSAFLVLTHPQQPSSVLLGRPDPSADWAHLAALDAERLQGLGDRWMLPASQLLEYESPRACANRILTEQLEGAVIHLEGPETFSEAYVRGPGEGAPRHWDLHFVFRGQGPTRGSRPKPWKELSYRRTVELPRAKYGRGHADILALAGFNVVSE